MNALASNAQSGLQTAQSRLRLIAHNAANQSFAADLAVLKTADQMMGSLLDTRA